jgi:hypothetical protein
MVDDRVKTAFAWRQHGAQTAAPRVVLLHDAGTPALLAARTVEVFERVPHPMNQYRNAIAHP